MFRRTRGRAPGSSRGWSPSRALALGLAFASIAAAHRAHAGTQNRILDPQNVAPIARLHVRADSAGAGFLPLLSNPTPVYPATPAPRPPYAAPTIDPVFGTRFMRITHDSAVALPPPIVSGTWGPDARHHYSKDQPWNSDGTLIAIQNSTSPDVVFLDGETYQVRFGECANYSRDDDRWHPSPAHPNVRINAKKDELMWFDVMQCAKTRSWTLPFKVKHIGDGEGTPSKDGRFIALCDSARMFVVDMDPQPPYAPYPAQRIGPVYDFIADCGLPNCRLGWVAVSPSGKYVVCKYGGDYPRVFDVNPVTLALTPRPMAPTSPRCVGTAAQGFLYSLGHCDMAMNPFDGGEDVLIGQEHCDWEGTVQGGQLIGNVMMARLRDGAITALTDPSNEAYPHHISTRNDANPGWAYVGFYPEPGKRFSDEIVAVKLDGSKAVRRFAHKHSDTSGDCYRCEAHAVPSADGRRVLWASNWNLDCTTCGSKTEIKAYVVDARDSAVTIHGTAPFAVVLDAGRSIDPDGAGASYTFAFGDGASLGPQAIPNARHTYAAGTWTARVTVSDAFGASDTATVQITASAPPVNLVGNGSFESSTSGWVPYGGSTLQRVAGGLEGSWSLRVQGPDSLLTYGVNDSPAWVPSVPTIGTRYGVEAWVRSTSSTGVAKIRVREYLNSVQQGVTTYSPAVTLSPAWQRLAVEYTAVALHSYLDVQVLDYPLARNESFEVDKIAIYELERGRTAVWDRPGAVDLAATLSPNPMRSGATLAFTLPRSGPLRVTVLDVHGREIARLADAPWTESGRHTFAIAHRDARGHPLAAGVYLYRIQTDAGVASGRFVILK